MVVPTYNERGNVEVLVERLRAALAGVAWRVIFVDDDSPDGTADAVKAMGTTDDRIECLHRIGRRGLAGAVIEGILASTSPFVAVIDGDLQHDETRLPVMLEALRSGADLAIGTRFATADGLATGLSRVRLAGSRAATWAAKQVLRAEVSDPVSGFFMARREIVERVAPRLSRQGFKILFDIIASQATPPRIVEIPYAFAERVSGDSKLDSRVVVDYAGLLISRWLGDAWPSGRFLLVVAAILIARLIAAANLHLSEDEAYYRLWSMAPAFGYYDHPPMIAWWIAIGRALVGDTALGVRLLPTLSAAVTSLLVFDMAQLAGGDRRTAERAGLWFNATLLVACGAFLAVPDAPASLFWCLALWSLLKTTKSDSIGWWLVAGAAAGLATLSKYSALFLGPGILLWLATSTEGRRRLLSPGPWLALVVAGGLFGLNVAWNASHHWLTFAKQFGRVAPHGFSARYLPELLIGQAFMLNPVIVIFLARWRPSRDTPAANLFFLGSLPFAAYLVLHSLHDRVQAHWPAPLYPAAAILAAFAASKLESRGWRWARSLVPAVAGLVMIGLMTLIALPPADFARAPDLFLPLRGWRAFAVTLDGKREAAGAAWIGTTSYGLASELADEQPAAPVLQISERDRWRGPTTGAAPRLDRPGIIVDLNRRLDPAKLAACFADVRYLGETPRGATGEKPKLYGAYRVAGPLRDIQRDGCW